MNVKVILLLLGTALLVAACDSGPDRSAEKSGAVRAKPVTATSAAGPDAGIPLGQLPPNVEPLHYSLDLTLNPDQLRYEGLVEIEIELKAPKREIYLHGKDLIVSRIVARQSGRPDVRGTYTQVNPDGVARLDFDQQLPSGIVTVSLPFSAAYETTPDALTAQGEDGIRYVWTQFQQISARRAFPSFDEPRFKTPFDISITHIGRHVAVSNTLPVTQETVAEGVTKTTFATTAPLPTYLVAIAVGPYEIATGPVIPPSRLRTAPLPIRAVTVMGKSDASRYALMETPPLVRALEDYFAAPFPYPKLDLITPPNFLAGGMENAGAITYTERGILLGPRPSVSQQRYFKLLHAHEVAHQWFGDLVTPRWWNDIWLNEAFASWIGNKISAETWPRDQFSRETARDALDIMDHDSLSTARAIRQPIVTNADIFNAFDGLTYDKGAAVLQMFENFLGAATFREGVRLHMRKFAHGTADTDDFIRSLAEASKKPEVAQAIGTFLNQPGLPLVSVETTCNGKDLDVTLKQSPYGATSKADSRVWSVPVCMRELANGRPLPCTLLGADSQKFTVRKLCGVALMPNASASGYYRFSMPASDWSRLATSFKSLNAAERLATLHAMRAAFRAGSTDANTYVAALRNAVTLGEWDVIELATGFLKDIHDDLLDASQRPVFEQNMRSWFAKPLASLSAGSSAAADTSAALSKAALAGLGVTLVRHPPALASFSARGAEILKSVAQAKNSPILDELAPASLWAFMSTGGTDAADAAIAALKATSEAETRNAIVRAMAAARDPAALARIQSHVLTGELRVRELFSYLRTAFANVDSRDASWLWLRKNFGSLLSLTGENAASRLVQLPSSLCSAAHETQIRKFFEPLQARIIGAPRTLANTLETVKRCADWKARSAREITGATLAPAK